MTGQARLAANVRHARLSAGLTVEALAFKAGLSVRSIYRIERSEHVPTAATLAAVAKALKTTVGDLRANGDEEAA